MLRRFLLHFSYFIFSRLDHFVHCECLGATFYAKIILLLYVLDGFHFIRPLLFMSLVQFTYLFYTFLNITLRGCIEDVFRLA